MALTNHAWNPASGTGWSFVSPADGTEHEFLGGGLHLKVGETFALPLSPAKATTIAGGGASDWGRIHSFDVTYEEESVGTDLQYRHQIAVSFDGGSTFYGPGANRLLDITGGINGGVGFTFEEFKTWREWPAASEVSSVKLILTIVRSDVSCDGILSALSVNEGTTQNIDIDGAAITLEPAEEDALPTFGLSTGTTYSGANPDWPIEMTLEMPVHESRHESGHIATYAHGTKFREVYTCHWGGRVDDSSGSVTEATDLIAFLESHVAASFNWTPPGSGAARTFVSSQPRVDVKAQMGSGRRVVDISATWTEVNA